MNPEDLPLGADPSRPRWPLVAWSLAYGLWLGFLAALAWLGRGGGLS